MKRSLFLVIVLLLQISGIAVAADTQKQREQKELDLKMIQLKMYDADQKANSLNGRLSSVPEESRREVNRLMKELGEKRQMAAVKVNELGSADNATWDRRKAEAYLAIDEVNSVCARIGSLVRR